MYFNFREKNKNYKPSQCFQIRKLENMYLNFREKNNYKSSYLNAFKLECWKNIHLIFREKQKDHKPSYYDAFNTKIYKATETLKMPF